MGLIIAFLAIPLIEIALFVVVGGAIGLWPTLAIVVGTAIAGVAVIRAQGRKAIEVLREAAQRRRDPTGQVADGMLVGLAGFLLILPGFLTDTLGLLLLLPPARRLAMRSLAARTVTSGRAGFDGAGRRGSEVIDGEFFEIDATDPDRLSSDPHRH